MLHERPIPHGTDEEGHDEDAEKKVKKFFKQIRLGFSL
jgi:hypothetical protein